MNRTLAEYRAALEAGLEARRKAGLLRAPSLPEGVDLNSNDYLGFATDPELAARVAEAVRSLGAGAGASRLLRGHLKIHEKAEARLAEFCGRPRALLFSSGYAANTGLIPALAGREDTLCCDELLHASLIDGARLSRARRVIFPHQDLNALEAELRASPHGRAFILTESLYSMDGDLTDLEALCDLAQRHGALLIVDEAHATGLYGERGSGRVEALGLGERVLCTTHTGGKALGVAGAWVAADAAVIAHLVNHARSFIFSTAMMPAMAAGLIASLNRLAADRSPVEAVHRKAAALRSRLRATGIDLLRSESQILPIVLGGNERALGVGAALRRQGFDVRAVRPPSVPEGTARLRVTVRAPLQDSEIERFVECLLASLEEVPA